MRTPRTARTPSATTRSAALLALALAAATGVGALPAQAAPRPLRTVVVSGPGDAAAAVRAAGGRVQWALPLIHGVVASLPEGAQLNPTFVVAANRSLAVAGRDGKDGKDGKGTRPKVSPIRGALGLPAPTDEGDGVTVAVVDTGVADVPDLAGRVTHVDVSGDGVGDGYGHGTFVAGLVAGDGSSSGGANAGIAPSAQVLDVRVAGDDGSTDLVTVLRGLQVVAQHPEVDVLNLSLSSDSPLPYEIDPLTMALEVLWHRGVLVVVPSGNDGDQGRGHIASPGVDPTLLTVGGLDTAGTADRSDDTVAAWSSQGPAPQGVSKPDLVAPGAHVISTGAPGSQVWTGNPGSQLPGGYLTGSGTSFATAVVSGSAAAILSDLPALTPDRLKDVLVATTYDVPGPRTSTGSGAADVAAALKAAARSKGKGHGRHGGDLPWGPGDRSSASSWDVQAWANAPWLSASWDSSAWGANAWAANAWAARQWAARQWSARQWSDTQWTARQWSARQWTARQWTAVDWE